jgi:inorganic triphosphatase YgiF
MQGGEGLIPRDLAGRGQKAGDPKGASDDALTPSEESLEVELKLAGTAKALETLWASAIAPRTKATRRRLISTYFDTSDLRLRRRGFTLRVREDGKNVTQTIKAEGGAANGVMRRGEWSTPIDGPTPDLAKFADAELKEKLGLVLAGELSPLFTTDVTRHIKTYSIGSNGDKKTKIEAAFDRGEVRSDGKTQNIVELELELLDGAPIALRREAARLHRLSPFRFEPLSKADRGFLLALGEHPEGHKAKLPDLSSDASVEAGLQHVFTNCTGHWLANHAAVVDGSDTEGVHQMRVALRRVRSAVTIFKSALPGDHHDWLQREAKSLINELGSARDWDVFVEELLQPILEARPDDGSLTVLRDAVNEERRQAYTRARQALGAPAYLEFVLDMGIWIEARGWRREETAKSLDRPLADLAQEVLRKRHKRSLKLGRDFEGLSDEALHRLRISLKKLRYATEFFVSLYGRERTKSYLASLRQLQDDLGHLNDVAVAESRLGELCARHDGDDMEALQKASGSVIGWYTHALAQIRPRIAQDWYAFTHTKTFWT